MLVEKIQNPELKNLIGKYDYSQSEKMKALSEALGLLLE